MMNGYALYDANNSTINEPTKRNNVFAIGKDLTLGTAPDPLIFLPAAGLRIYSDGKVYNTGSYGDYWSSTVGSNISYIMYFCSSFVYADGSGHRADGRSVRCLAE